MYCVFHFLFIQSNLGLKCTIQSTASLDGFRKFPLNNHICTVYCTSVSIGFWGLTQQQMLMKPQYIVYCILYIVDIYSQ